MGSYRVWLEGGDPGSESVEQWASTAAEAAEEWAKEVDRRFADFNISGGDPQRVCVQRIDGMGRSDVQTFIVTGEVVTMYHAHEAK